MHNPKKGPIIIDDQILTSLYKNQKLAGWEKVVILMVWSLTHRWQVDVSQSPIQRQSGLHCKVGSPPLPTFFVLLPPLECRCIRSVLMRLQINVRLQCSGRIVLGCNP